MGSGIGNYFVFRLGQRQRFSQYSIRISSNCGTEDAGKKKVDSDGIPKKVLDLNDSNKTQKDKNRDELLTHAVGGKAVVRTARLSGNYFPKSLQSGYVLWDRMIHEIY